MDDREKKIRRGERRLMGWPQGLLGYDQETVGWNESRQLIAALELYQDKDGRIIKSVPGDPLARGIRETFTHIGLATAKELMPPHLYEDLVTQLRKRPPPAELPTAVMPTWKPKDAGEIP